MKITRKHCLKALKWCKVKWGLSEYFTFFPSLVVHRKTISQLECEEFYVPGEHKDDNVIHIYLKRIEDLDSLCEIMIHEYWHYMQSSDEYWKIHEKMNRTKMYTLKKHDEHPHEKKCNKYASKFKDQCLYDVMNELKKK